MWCKNSLKFCFSVFRFFCQVKEVKKLKKRKRITIEKKKKIHLGVKCQKQSNQLEFALKSTAC
jgi:hypothetical protein